MRKLPVSNPVGRWDRTAIEYDGGETPDADVEVIDDRSQSIIAKNDSPDVGFDYSVNPYRGCMHACAYCLSPDTLILMGDSTLKPLRDVRVGDSIYGTRPHGAYRRYVKTKVLRHWWTMKPAYRVRANGVPDIIASGDHRFLTERGWNYVTGAEQGRLRRPHLTEGNRLLGVGGCHAPAPPETDEYRRGYLTGMIRGDALLKSYRYQREGRAHGDQHQFRLALIDMDALRRSRRYLADASISTSDEYVFQRAEGAFKQVTAIRTSARSMVDRIRAVVSWPEAPSREWQRGFLAGIFDAEGSHSRGVLRVSNTSADILGRVVAALRDHRFDCVLEPPSRSAVASNVRVRGGLREHLRFFHLTDPAIRRKWSLEGVALKSTHVNRVESIRALGVTIPMIDITTGTGDFIANGVVSHNCYARPTHEYLSLGAGTDFDRKIVVKRRAPELLREAFEKKSWKGDLVVFSGVTDCYQPLEAQLGLTRGCLEVCALYKNPIGLITKGATVERDIDVLSDLVANARATVSVSLPFLDAEKARAMEPYAPSPARRLRIIERLAAAGIPVGVSVSPVIPGLSDQEIPRVLTAAREAGATHAFSVFLRLPGAVAPVFEERVRAGFPLRADKILRRVREAHDGKLYDPRFGERQRGRGQYAQMIETLFKSTAERLGLVSREDWHKELPTTFSRPRSQLSLF